MLAPVTRKKLEADARREHARKSQQFERASHSHRRRGDQTKYLKEHRLVYIKAKIVKETRTVAQVKTVVVKVKLYKRDKTGRINHKYKRITAAIRQTARSTRNDSQPSKWKTELKQKESSTNFELISPPIPHHTPKRTMDENATQ